MDKLEELGRQYRSRGQDWGLHQDERRAYEAVADDLSALRDYVLVPREPTQEDLERVARAIHDCLLRKLSCSPIPERLRGAVSESAWAAIVGGRDETFANPTCSLCRGRGGPLGVPCDECGGERHRGSI